eukprot:NP_497645.2 Uncharacterized protein CELE_H05C05.3 [Caenorhabditis elegans]
MSRSDLCEHFQNYHESHHELDTVVFRTKNDFEAWFSQRQEDTGSTLTTRTSTTDGKRKVTLMNCIHEGSHEPKVVQGLKHVFSARPFGLVQLDQKFTVEACFQHYGHEIKVADLSLTSNQKMEISALASKGLSNNAIIEELKKSSDELSKLFYLLPQDIRNLRNSLNLNEEQLDRDDLESVKKRVMLGDPADGFRHFTLPDENGLNFTLVVITPQHMENLKKYSHKMVLLDDTHNVSRFLVIQLDNIIRNRNFFGEIKKLLPEFQPAYFMTDEANCFWNGFSDVFDNTRTHKVICRWHVLHMAPALKIRKKAEKENTPTATRDPALDPDTHPEQHESRITDWKRCILCKNPAHYDCTLIVNDKCPCSNNSKFELYPSNFQIEFDSDESSDS